MTGTIPGLAVPSADGALKGKPATAAWRMALRVGNLEVADGKYDGNHGDTSGSLD